ncbi:adenylate cyclase [Pikeienuella piscinae]|uniref:Adenylate cyclase n=1 Tax=Pikeienuella piscinae TaxID=2748098 RepID=A0A7L5BUZ5_9RHOB|nr:adenylate/guanylate cyclase domain-containing protein [Pikeienuella piscinae]QIE55522.1 adenylate cyclase [Pikeienuella piscinae]
MAAETLVVSTPKRRLAAVAFADVAGFSRLMGLDDVGTIEKWRALRREVMEPLILESEGRLVEMAGDALLVEFPSAVHALRWACDIQQANERPGAEETALRLRVGVNIDDVIDDGDTLQGDGVNIAARIHQAAEPGQVVVTGAVMELVGSRLPVSFHDLGSPPLKNIDRPVRVFSVRWEQQDAGVALHHPYLEWSTRPSIAVLPLRTIGGEAESDYLADGVVEDIIAGLSRSRALHVIARASMWRFAGEQMDVRSVAAQLGVGYVLSGSVRRSGTRLRIVAELIHVANSRAIWTERFDGDESEIFELQDRILASVLSSIENAVSEIEYGAVRSRRTSSLDAYQCVLKASSLLYDFTPATFSLTGQALDRAMELDPRYARAFATSAWRLNFLVAEQLSADPEGDAAKAIEHAEKAIYLDPTDPFSLAVAGHVISFIGRRPEEALELFDSALNIDSSSAIAWALSGDTLAYLGRPDEAMKRFRNVWKLNPFDRLNFFWWGGAGIAEFVGGRYHESIGWLKRALRANPRFVATLRMLAAAQALAGEQNEAQATSAKLLAVYPDFSVARFVELYPLTRKDDLERLERGLLSAGLPR